MFDKDEIEESLGKKTSALLYWGARLAKASYIVVGLGLLLILFGAISPGRIITIVGVNTGFIGLAVHYFAKVEQSSGREVLQELYRDARTLYGEITRLVRLLIEKIREKISPDT